MSRRSKEKVNERPLYSGRTSYIYLGVARRIIAILVVNVPLTLLAFAASILWTVFGLFGERELFTKLVEIIGGRDRKSVV